VNQAATADIAASIINEPGYAGKLLVPGKGIYGIIAAPKATGEHEPTVWNKSMKRVEGAMSFYDGLANTEAMAKAGSKLAQWALDQGLHIPSRDELELLYRHRKPSNDKNWCYRGDNPSSVPVGYAYMPNDPAQTAIEEFRQGGVEAFELEGYWSSTQCAGYVDFAWLQHFDGGSQGTARKGSGCRARAVRRVLINPAI